MPPPRPNLQPTVALATALWCVLGGPLRAGGDELDGLLEPYRTVNLASAESGVLVRILASDGQRVRAGQALAVLDSELQQTQLEIGRLRMEGRGELNYARSEFLLRQQRLQQLEELRAEGHARQEEVDRARTDLAVAAARVQSAEEDLAVRKLEFQRAQQNLDRRTIRSPIDGLVATIDREEGEFVSPVRPEIATVIQGDPMLAVFSVPIKQASQLPEGQTVEVLFLGGQRVIGQVESVGVTIDAASGTVQVQVRLPNKNGRLLSGQTCRIRLESLNPRMLPPQ